MMRILLLCWIFQLSISLAVAQEVQPDSAIVSGLRKAGNDHLQVMSILSALTDVNGPRLTNSRGYVTAAEYAKRVLESWGVLNVHFDYWEKEFGKGWELKKFALSMVQPGYAPLIAYPKAWSPGVKGTLRAEAIYLEVNDESDLAKYKGKLKGKFVLLSEPVTAGPSFKADAWRHADSTLQEMADAKATTAYRGRRTGAASPSQRLVYLKWELCQREGAAAVLEASSRLENDGTLVVSAATVPYSPETPYAKRRQGWDPDVPKILPQIVVAAEHYNRIVRQLRQGAATALELTLQTEFTPSVRGFNVIGEIPGTDLGDEVVMIGAHLDSWHSSTGATDNAVGSAVMMEAMRLIASVGTKPRRTIRIALWGGEEQGLIGSRSYVKRKLGERLDQSYPYDSIRLTAEGEKFSVYFNMDYGAGKYRGIYLQGNEDASPVFREWLKPFAQHGGGTISLRNATGTDHLSFDAIGLPAFQFIQDPLEYATRTHHANMDVYDKVVADDLQFNAIMTAYLAWKAANA
ncbi:MAG: M20/M25/M40 family metallo-hydrolase, partial [Bacteroidota bacterium]|nr:M20/M25/M40 family metallo-hydrolase [Bacteroidota bacterium]